MGITKTDFFSAKQNRIAQLFKALGHPARIAIVEYLLNTPNCICGDIVDKIQLAQPTVSQHLRELKNADIIRGTIDGNAICYCLNEKILNELQTYFLNTSTKIKKQKTKCC